MKHRRKLSESVEGWIDSTDYTTMTDEEQWWHKKITNILLNKTGKWGPYQHALYAMRFQDFVLKIVPLSVDDQFTACVIFDRAVVYVGEGFLVDDDKCFQLNVIIRHEMAHILLRHEIRMANKIGELPYSRISTSMSLGKLINIIADFEISNKKYNSEDKGIVLNMYLNGKLISGLVTEMHRDEWMKLSLEEMYDKLVDELDEISSEIEGVGGSEHMDDLGYRSKIRTGIARDDMITKRALSTIAPYSDKTTPSIIWEPAKEYFSRSVQFAKCAKSVKKFVIYTYSTMEHFDEAKLNELLEEIATSRAFNFVKVTDDFELATPEEKYWAMQVIKNLLGNARVCPKVTIKRLKHSKEYVDAYNAIIRRCGSKGSCSVEDILEILGGEDMTVASGIEELV